MEIMGMECRSLYTILRCEQGPSFPIFVYKHLHEGHLELLQGYDVDALDLENFMYKD
jgi:hypothetical protein